MWRRQDRHQRLIVVSSHAHIVLSRITFAILQPEYRAFECQVRYNLRLIVVLSMRTAGPEIANGQKHQVQEPGTVHIALSVGDGFV